MSSLPLLISLCTNGLQYAEAFYKTYKENQLKKEELIAKQKENNLIRKHELEKLKLNEDIYRSHQVVPKARQICLEYIGATETEIAQSKVLPVCFSSNQRLLEVKVILYVPEARQAIENFQELDSASLVGGKDYLGREFRNNVIPVLANALENFQLKRK